MSQASGSTDSSDLPPGSVREMVRRLQREASEAMQSAEGEMVRRAKVDLAEIRRRQSLGWSVLSPARPKPLALTGTDDRGRTFRITIEEID